MSPDEAKSKSDQDAALYPQEIPGRPVNVLYALDVPDGILIPCKTAKGGHAYIPLNLLIGMLEQRIARRLRMSGIKEHSA